MVRSHIHRAPNVFFDLRRVSTISRNRRYQRSAVSLHGARVTFLVLIARHLCVSRNGTLGESTPCPCGALSINIKHCTGLLRDLHRHRKIPVPWSWKLYGLCTMWKFLPRIAWHLHKCGVVKPVRCPCHAVCDVSTGIQPVKIPTTHRLLLTPH